MMEQRLVPACLHLCIDCGEVRVVLLMGVAHVQDGKPSFLEPRGYRQS